MSCLNKQESALFSPKRLRTVKGPVGFFLEQNSNCTLAASLAFYARYITQGNTNIISFSSFVK